MATENGKYIHEKSAGEVDRLQKQHVWFKNSLENRIIFAPVDLKKPGIRILDIGCADGTLLRDLEKDVSSGAELVGMDISESFLPTSSQTSIRYMVGDVKKPLPEELLGKFDVVHLRFTLNVSGKLDLDQVISNLTAALKPGGWLQIQEPDFRPESWTDKTLLSELAQILGDLVEKLGGDRRYASKLNGAFERAGLEDVSARQVEYPVGAKAANEDMGKIGIEAFKELIPTALMAAKEHAVNVPESVARDLEHRFEEEMQEKGGVYWGFIVLGQKPASS